jgi:uncharacterized protein YdhG (YjbR/CyaY superfamily)
MKKGQTKPQDIDDYIARHPKDIQVLLEKLRATIRKAAPKARETIKYQMPTFTLNGNLVYFAAFKNHIGFFPLPSGVDAFEKVLSTYERGKGSIRFPLDKPLPLALISKIVKFRVKRDLDRATARAKKKKK